MDFLNRKEEIKWLSEMHAHSKKKLFPIVIYGPRRVGKTLLIRQFMRGKTALYIYVNETKSSHVLAKEAADAITAAEGLDELVALDDWDKILRYLIERSSFEIIVFDEFQNFLSVDKSVFGILQNLIDRNENRALMLVFLGSSTGMVKEVFEDASAALYGRIKAKLLMKPLAFREFYSGIRALGYRDAVDIAGLFLIFGGYPKYLVALEDFEVGAKPLEDVVEFLFFTENAPLQNEVRDLLRAEFGNRGAQNYSILEAIATGHTKLSEISSYVGIPATSVSAFLNALCDYHGIVEKNIPLLRPAAKETRYAIKNPMFRFWFRFVRPNESSLELGRYELFKQEFKRGFSTYAGREFERLAKEHLISSLKIGRIDFSELGSWWHKDREIDIITLGKDACVWECKWSIVDNRKASDIALSLKENASYAGIRSPKLGLIAREIGNDARDYFDYAVSLGDIIEGKLPYGKRRDA